MCITSKNNKTIRNGQRDAFEKIQKSSSDNQMVRSIVKVKIKALISLRNYCFFLLNSENSVIHSYLHII